MAQRTNWRFRFTAGRLTEAATARAEYHERRLAFWQAELATIEPQVREAVQLRTYPVTGGNRLDVHVEGDIGTRYQECQSKIAGHEKDLADYERYRRAFALAAAETIFDLDVDDVAYFDL